MASRDMISNIKLVMAIEPDVYKNAQSPTGDVIDTKGFESVTLLLIAGTVTDSQTLTLKDSYQVDSDFADVEAADVIGGADVLADFLAVDDAGIKALGYNGGKRYLKAASTATGTDGAIYGVIAVLGHPKYGPVGKDEEGESEEA